MKTLPLYSILLYVSTENNHSVHLINTIHYSVSIYFNLNNLYKPKIDINVYKN